MAREHTLTATSRNSTRAYSSALVLALAAGSLVACGTGGSGGVTWPATATSTTGGTTTGGTTTGGTTTGGTTGGTTTGGTTVGGTTTGGTTVGGTTTGGTTTGGTTTGGGGVPPTTPGNLTGNPDGPFHVVLAWQASTSSVGIKDYRVERCTGGGCSNFVQVAAPTTNAYTDTGLDPATSYSYRVRASDLNVTFSSYSNSASAVTAASTPPPLPTLPAWVSALSIGQWFAIPNTPLSSVEPNPLPPGNGPDAKVVAWTSFVVDTRNSRLYTVANGGHNDYAGNEVDMLDLETANPQWVQLLAPSPSNTLTNCQGYYTDDRPSSRHSYYGVTLNEFNDRIMLFAGAEWCASGGFGSSISSYNITANTYSPSSTHGTVTAAFGIGVAAYTLNPLTGDVYASHSHTFARWTRSTNTFAEFTPNGSGPTGDDETMSAMDTTRGRILYVGGNSSDHALYTLATNTASLVTLTGPNAATLLGAGQSALLYIPAIDMYFSRMGAAGGTVLTIDPSTFATGTFATTGGANVPLVQRVYNKFLYVPRLRGIVYVPEYSTNVWFLRVH